MVDNVTTQQPVGYEPMRDACRLARRIVRTSYVRFLIVAMISSAAHFALKSWSAADEIPQRTDPAAWGSDHVGQNFPEYMTGDECLFCHRRIGPSWNNNRHQCQWPRDLRHLVRDSWV